MKKFKELTSRQRREVFRTVTKELNESISMGLIEFKGESSRTNLDVFIQEAIEDSYFTDEGKLIKYIGVQK
jgi:hypothetical protein